MFRILQALVLILYTATCFSLTDTELEMIDRIIHSGETRIPAEDVLAIGKFGAAAHEQLNKAYEQADAAGKARLANLFWRLGAKNPDATELLLADAKTRDRSLRLSVQYALGSVSDDPIVVETLLDTMLNDNNGLFRDKAACALANDQPHLDYHQKYELYRGLIIGMSNELFQIRDISFRVLKIHTGQSLGYTPYGGPEKRVESLVRWNEWLAEYQQSL